MALVIQGGKLIDGTGCDPLSRSIVVVEDGLITTVGGQDQVGYPRESQILDAHGKTVLPGFIDCHAHLIAYEYGLEKQLTTPASLTVVKTMRNLRATLEAGVTTVRDAGGVDLGIKMAVEQGLIPGPRLLISVFILAQKGGLFDLFVGSGAKLDTTNMFGKHTHFCGGVETVRHMVRALVHSGADVIKFMATGSIHAGLDCVPPPQFAPEEIEAIIYEAHAADKRTMVHAEGGRGLRTAVKARVDSVEHGFCLDANDIEVMLEEGTFFVPTLACNYGILQIAGQHPEAGIHYSAVEAARRAIDGHAAGVQQAAQAGVKIAMGSDSFGWYQGDNLLELELLAQAGLSPMQALMAGTRLAAECLGLQERLGTIEAGKIADILVVDGDPLAEIGILQHKDKLLLIMKEGKIFKDHLTSQAGHIWRQ